MAEGLECCRVMALAGLYGRFAVRIEKQREKATEAPRGPKESSFGWVACFDERAARLIVGAISHLEPEGALFEHGARWYQKMLKDADLGFTWKDLRRASLYWIGHYTKMNRVQLKSHSRHKGDESLDLYLRRPDEEVERSLDLD